MPNTAKAMVVYLSTSGNTKAISDAIDPVLRIQYKPINRDIKEAERLGMDIAEKLKNA